MKLFVSTNCLRATTPLPEKLKMYASVGILRVDLGAGVTVSENDLTQLGDASNYEFQIHNYFPPPPNDFVLNLASPDPRIVQLSKQMTTDAVDLLSTINGTIYSVHPGFVTDPTGFNGISFTFPPPKLPRDQVTAMKRFTTNLRSLVNYAEKANIQVIVENQVIDPQLKGKILLETASEFTNLFQSISSPNLGMLLDTGHLNVTSHTLGFDRMKFVEPLVPYIKSMHVHDNDGSADYHLPVAPNSWIFEILQHPLLKSVPIVIEAKFKSLAHLSEHFHWLEERLS